MVNDQLSYKIARYTELMHKGLTPSEASAQLEDELMREKP